MTDTGKPAAVWTQSAVAPIPEESPGCTQGPEVVNRRDHRAFPTAQPTGTKVGEQIVDVDDIWRELSERRRRVRADPGDRAHGSLDRVGASPHPVVGVLSHQQDIVTSVAEGTNLSVNNDVLPARNPGRVIRMNDGDSH